MPRHAPPKELTLAEIDALADGLETIARQLRQSTEAIRRTGHETATPQYHVSARDAIEQLGKFAGSTVQESIRLSLEPKSSALRFEIKRIDWQSPIRTSIV